MELSWLQDHQASCRAVWLLLLTTTAQLRAAESLKPSRQYLPGLLELTLPVWSWHACVCPCTPSEKAISSSDRKYRVNTAPVCIIYGRMILGVSGGWITFFTCTRPLIGRGHTDIAHWQSRPYLCTPYTRHRVTLWGQYSEQSSDWEFSIASAQKQLTDPITD